MSILPEHHAQPPTDPDISNVDLVADFKNEMKDTVDLTFGAREDLLALIDAVTETAGFGAVSSLDLQQSSARLSAGEVQRHQLAEMATLLQWKLQAVAIKAKALLPMIF
jgi:hypothetical protein